MFPYLMNSLLEGPGTLRLLVALIEPDRWDTPTGPDRFSPRQVAAHLADWEPIFRSRISRALDEASPTIDVFDETERAASLDYAKWDMEQTLVSFRTEREATHRLLARMEAGGWERTVQHPENGPMTVLQMAGMLVGHDAYHIRQLIEVVSVSHG